MRETGRAVQTANSLPNLVDDVNEENEWSCSMCTFHNHPLLNQCEQCDMPRVHQGIKITRSSYRPLKRENNQLQGSSSSANNSPECDANTNNNNNNINQNIATTTTAL